MGEWEPSSSFFNQLMAKDSADTDVSRPYPFFLAHALDQPVESLGVPSQWQAEWKWDGIRSQLIRRSQQTFLWSRGEELVTERFPEIASIGQCLPDGTVIDGEILPWKDDQPLPFAQLQRRIGRKTVSRSLLAQVPVVLMAYDLLEYHGIDIRNQTLERRRENLANLVGSMAAQGVARNTKPSTFASCSTNRLVGVTTAMGNQPGCPRRRIDA